MEEKGWERRNTSLVLPAAGTGEGQEAKPRRDPLKSLRDPALILSDAARSSQFQRCHTMSGHSALIIWGLAVTPSPAHRRLVTEP